MKIERYIKVLVVLTVGLFLVNASWPEATFAEGNKAATGPTWVQCNAPVDTWCVPATSGAGVVGTFCTANAPAPVTVANPVVTTADSAFDLVASIVAVPFAVGQCLLGECP